MKFRQVKKTGFVHRWNRFLSILYLARDLGPQELIQDYGNLIDILQNPEEFLDSRDCQKLKVSQLWSDLRGQIWESLTPRPWNKCAPTGSVDIIKIEGIVHRFHARGIDLTALERLTNAAYPRQVLECSREQTEESICLLSQHHKRLKTLARNTRQLQLSCKRLDSRIATWLGLPEAVTLESKARYINSVVTTERDLRRAFSFVSGAYMPALFAFRAEQILRTRRLYKPELTIGVIHQAIGRLENVLFHQNVAVDEYPPGCPAVKEQIRLWTHGEYRKFDVRSQLEKYLELKD